jgi:hypothetical protein
MVYLSLACSVQVPQKNRSTFRKSGKVVKNGHQLTAQKAAPETNRDKRPVKLTCAEDMNVPSRCHNDIRTLQQHARNQEEISLQTTFSTIPGRI